MSDRQAVRDATLVESLRVAVQLRMLEIRGWTAEQRTAEAHRYGPGGGDVLQYGGGRKGEVGKVFAALARGLAALAYQPGGVTFAGVHWCAGHAECVAAAAQAELVPDPPHPARAVVDLALPE